MKRWGRYFVSSQFSPFKVDFWLLTHREASGLLHIWGTLPWGIHRTSRSILLSGTGTSSQLHGWHLTPLRYSAQSIGETHIIPGLWPWPSFGCTSFAWGARFKVLQPGGWGAFLGLKGELMWLQRAGSQHMPSSPGQPGLQGAQPQDDWGAGAGRQTWQMDLGLALLSQPGVLLGFPAAQHIWREVCSPIPSRWTPLRCSREIWQRHKLKPCHGEDLPLRACHCPPPR